MVAVGDTEQDHLYTRNLDVLPNVQLSDRIMPCSKPVDGFELSGQIYVCICGMSANPSFPGA